MDRSPPATTDVVDRVACGRHSRWLPRSRCAAPHGGPRQPPAAEHDDARGGAALSQEPEHRAKAQLDALESELASVARRSSRTCVFRGRHGGGLPEEGRYCCAISPGVLDGVDLSSRRKWITSRPPPKPMAFREVSMLEVKEVLRGWLARRRRPRTADGPESEHGNEVLPPGSREVRVARRQGQYPGVNAGEPTPRTALSDRTGKQHRILVLICQLGRH
jgi:hypothetical protein